MSSTADAPGLRTAFRITGSCAGTTAARDVAVVGAVLFGAAANAPAAARALPKLADRARAEQWSYEQFAAVLLKTETDSRDSHGGQARIKAARFPARKTLEEFDFAFQTSVRRDSVLHLGQLDFLAGKENVVLLGPPGTGKTHLSIALGIRACLAGHRVAFRTATEWVALLADAPARLAPGRIDYVQLVDADDLRPIDLALRPALCALAVFVGGVRLIESNLRRILKAESGKAEDVTRQVERARRCFQSLFEAGAENRTLTHRHLSIRRKIMEVIALTSAAGA